MDHKACLVLSVGGVRYDAFAKSRTPCIDRLGAAALAQTQLTADCRSAPGWTSVLTGLEATMHGALDNEVLGTSTIERGRGTLLARARRELGRKTAAMCEWNPLLARIIEEDALNIRVGGPADVVEAAAIEAIRQHRADMIFVHLDEVDREGRATGYDPDNARYVAAIEAVDARVGRLLDVLATAASDEASRAASAALPRRQPPLPPLASGGAARLRCAQSRAFTPVWSTTGHGEVAPCGVWRPKLAPGEVFFGDFVTTSPAYPFGRVATIAPESGAAEALLRRACSFTLRWHSEAKGSAPPLFVWSAIAPDGFVALGFVATTTEEAPPAEDFRCVARCALRPVAADAGGAGLDPFQLWKSSAAGLGAGEVAAPPAAFWRGAVEGVARLRVGSHAPPSSCADEDAGWCLRSEDAVEARSASPPEAALGAALGAVPSPPSAPREWLVVFVVDHGGEGLEHGARNAANRRVPQRFAVGTFDAAAGAMRWRDAPRDDAQPAPNRRRVPSHLDVHRRVLRWLGAPASSAANCPKGAAGLSVSALGATASSAAATARRAQQSSAHPQRCLCGCNPPAPSMFEMARRRKEAREAKARAAPPTSLQRWLTGGGGGEGSASDVVQI